MEGSSSKGSQVHVSAPHRGSAIEYLYAVHGVRVRFAVDNATTGARLQKTLAFFAERAPLRPGCAEIRFSTIRDRNELPHRLSRDAELILEAEPGDGRGATPETLGCRIYRDRGVMVVEFGDMGGFVLDVAEGLVEGRLVDPKSIPPSVHVGILHFALCEMLKRYGVYRIHAACVARNGTAYLFPGRSGSGKTTCCVSMLRAGYGYLADDCTLLRRGIDGSEALCFPTSPKILDRTRGLFPELAGRSDPREVYSTTVVESCSPAFIVFPRITDCSRSRLEPLPKSQALGELLPQTLVISDRAIARAQTDTLSALVARARCYRLHFGADAAALPDLVAELGSAA